MRSEVTVERESMAQELEGKRIAILATDGFELLEMTEPRAALEAAGAQTFLIAPNGPEIKAWNIVEWGPSFKVDLPLAKALSLVQQEPFDALHLPGGVLNPDSLRTNGEAVFFVKRFFFDEGRPVSALCHAPWTLITADVVRGRTLTSWPSLQDDLRNAGANWVNKEVVRDETRDNVLITGRSPADVPAFNKMMVQAFESGRRQPVNA